jgi:hypothetical protein
MACGGHTKGTVGLVNVNSIYLNNLLYGRSWPYQQNRGVVKCKLYTFKHPLRWSVVVIRKKRRVVKCKLYTFKHPLRW